jgi:hypothetical protein
MTRTRIGLLVAGAAMLAGCTDPYSPNYAYSEGYRYPPTYYRGGYRSYPPEPAYYPTRYGQWPAGGYYAGSGGPQITFAATFP